MRHRLGFVAVISEVVKFAVWHVQVFVGGNAAYAELVRHGSGKMQQSYLGFVFLLSAVRIVLHQLPPPWLLLYSALTAWFVWANYQAVPELWSGVWRAVPVWVQVGMLAGSGLVVVVAQEATSRAKHMQRNNGDPGRAVQAET